MFAIYDYSIRAALAFTLMLLYSFSLAHADNKLSLHEELSGAVCNVSGECALDISDIAKNILLACETPRVEVTWNRTKNNVFLIACDCECTSHDNTGWLVSKDIAAGEHKVWKLHLGKKYTVEELGRPMINIPDLFHSHPLCSEPDKRLLEASVFVSLVKYPINNEISPYCFSPIYIAEENQQLIINDASDESSAIQYYENDNPAAYAEILNVVDEIKY